MAQHTSLIPLVPRVSTLVVDGDLDLSGYTITAKDLLIEEKGIIEDNTSNKITVLGGMIQPGNDVINTFNGWEPIEIGNQVYKTLTKFTLPELIGQNNFSVGFTFTTESGVANISYYWNVLVDDVVVHSCAGGGATSSPWVVPPLAFTDITKNSVFEIEAMNTHNVYLGDEMVSIIDIQIVGDMQAWYALQGMMPSELVYD